MYCDFFFSSRRRHTRLQGDWSSDVCSSDLVLRPLQQDREVERLVEQVRKGMPLVDRQRRQHGEDVAAKELGEVLGLRVRDRKSTRLNSSHLVISYAVFCLKKKNSIHVHSSY